MASTEFPRESRHSSHSSIDLYSTSAKRNLQFVSDQKCAADSRPRVDRFSPAQRRVITPEQEGSPETPRAHRERDDNLPHAHPALLRSERREDL
jgi:hypothetical protein